MKNDPEELSNLQHSQGEQLPREGKAFRHVALGDAVNTFLPSTAGHLQAAPVPSLAGQAGHTRHGCLVGGLSGGGGRPHTQGKRAGSAHANKRSLSGSAAKGLAFAGLKLPF